MRDNIDSFCYNSTQFIHIRKQHLPNNKNNYGSLRKRQNKAMVGANRFSPSLAF